MKILVSTLLMACVVPISMQAQTLHKVRTDMAETLPKVDNAKLTQV